MLHRITFRTEKYISFRKLFCDLPSQHHLKPTSMYSSIQVIITQTFKYLAQTASKRMPTLMFLLSQLSPYIYINITSKIKAFCAMNNKYLFDFELNLNLNPQACLLAFTLRLAQVKAASAIPSELVLHLVVKRLGLQHTQITGHSNSASSNLCFSPQRCAQLACMQEVHQSKQEICVRMKNDCHFDDFIFDFRVVC